jgi:hypothetical protein
MQRTAFIEGTLEGQFENLQAGLLLLRLLRPGLPSTSVQKTRRLWEQDGNREQQFQLGRFDRYLHLLPASISYLRRKIDDLPNAARVR